MIVLLKYAQGCGGLLFNPGLDIRLSKRPKRRFRETNTKQVKENVLLSVRGSIFIFGLKGPQERQ